MVACPHRGLTLELFLVKLLQSGNDIQIIGMSATMGGEAAKTPFLSLISQLASVTALHMGTFSASKRYQGAGSYGAASLLKSHSNYITQ